MHTSRPPLTPFFTAGTRSPALVTLPGRNAPRGARLVRLRVRDRPGSLAAVTGHLAQYGVDVIRVEVDEIAENERFRYVHFRAPDGALYELVEQTSGR